MQDPGLVKPPFYAGVKPKLLQILRIMKLTVLILLVCVQVSANSFSQKVTLTLNKAPLKTAFESITKQTGYRFFYNDDQLKASKPVTIHIRGMAVEEALKLCFKNQPFSWSIVGQVIVVKERSFNFSQPAANESMPPPIDVKGRVMNEKGEPVEGATVTVKGTTQGVSTNANGEFELKGIEGQAVLIISGVSIETREIRVDGRSDLAFIAAKTKIIENDSVQIVSTGYQQLPRERVTGSFSKVDNKLFNEQVSTNILSRLEGVANSMSVYRKQFGDGQIMVRGLSTLNGPKSPLIVVDNFPYEGNINNINPNDVQSITILKDAAAASIWGTRAGNGVIVITTKKGKFNQPVKVEFNSNVNIIEQPDLFYFKNITTSDYIDVETFLYGKGYYNSLFTNNQRPAVSEVVELLRKRSLGQITAADSAARIDALRNIDVRNDFDKYFYQNGVNQQYALNVRGGSNNMAWIASFGFDKNANELDAKYQRLNIRLENVYKPVPALQVSTGFYFTAAKDRSGRTAYSPTAFPSYTRFADDNGNPLPAMKTYRQAWLDTAGGGKLLDWNYYPLTEYQHINNTNRVTDIMANLGLNYKLITGIEVDVKYQYERQQSTGRTLYDQESYYLRDYINTFTNIAATDPYKRNPVPKGDMLDMSNNLLESHKLRSQINLNKAWNRHELVAIIGNEINQARRTGNTGRVYGYNDAILTSLKVDYINTYPTYITGAQSTITDNVDFTDVLNRFVSFYGNAAYTYNKKYTLSASARRDASNLFGVSTNDRWKPLWSAGMSWNISREAFYRFAAIPYLSVRATYGYSGNVDPAKSAVTTISYRSSSPYTQTPTARFDQYNNPELRWEKVGQVNVGIDFRTAKNILSGSIEYYIKNATDLYGPTLVDYTGVSTATITKNVASMKVRGIDVELNSNNINTRSFSWSSRLNWSYYRDKVTAYYIASLQGANLVNAGIGISSIAGKPAYAVFSYKWAGLDPLTGDPQGYLDGKISKDYSKMTGTLVSLSDIRYNGPAMPVVFGSLGNTFRWKDFSASIVMMYEFGAYFQKASVSYNNLFSTKTGHADYALRWQKPGDEQFTNVPSIVYPANSSRDNFYTSSELLIAKADNIRLKYVTLSYDIRGDRFNNRFLDNIQLYATVNNPGFIWRANKDGLDPAVSKSALPLSRNMALGLRANF